MYSVKWANQKIIEQRQSDNSKLFHLIDKCFMIMPVQYSQTYYVHTKIYVKTPRKKASKLAPFRHCRVTLNCSEWKLTYRMIDAPHKNA